MRFPTKYHTGKFFTQLTTLSQDYMLFRYQLADSRRKRKVSLQKKRKEKHKKLG